MSNKTLKHLPGSEEWLQERLLGIGGSDASTVMGCNPWMTPHELWEEKLELRMPQAESAPMNYGKMMEPMARSLYEQQVEEPFFAMARIHPEHSWMRGSIDGINMDETKGIEIKCPFIRNNDLPELYKQAMKGVIPEYYQIQMQHLMAVYDLSEMDYICFLDVEKYEFMNMDLQPIIVIPVKRDDGQIEKIIEAERSFWDMVESKTEPPLSDKDHAIMASETWNKLSDEWKVVHEQIKMLKAREEDLRARLIEESGDRNATGNGLRLTRYVRAGNVDYKAIPELEAVDLNKYRKKETVMYKLSKY